MLCSKTDDLTEVFDYNTPLTVNLSSSELAQRVEILHDIIALDEDATEEEQTLWRINLAETAGQNEPKEWI